MLYYVLNTDKMRLIAVCETEPQALAHANKYCKNDNFLLFDEDYQFPSFSELELIELLAYVTAGPVPESIKDNKEKLIEGIHRQIQKLDVSKEIPVPANVQAVETAPTEKPEQPSQPRAPRQKGKTKEVVWTLMDTKYEAAGSPSDVKEVLALRKELMNEMADSHPEISRAAVSNQLAGWWKEQQARV